MFSILLFLVSFFFRRLYRSRSYIFGFGDLERGPSFFGKVQQYRKWESGHAGNIYRTAK